MTVTCPAVATPQPRNRAAKSVARDLGPHDGPIDWPSRGHSFLLREQVPEIVFASAEPRHKVN